MQIFVKEIFFDFLQLLHFLGKERVLHSPLNLAHGSQQAPCASPQSNQRLPYVFSGVRNEGLHLVEVESVLRLLGRRRHQPIDLR